MKKGGLTADGVAAKLREYNGNMAAVAREFGVTRTSVYNYCKRRPKLMEVSAECREGMKDHAESSLHRAILAGEAWAVCFYLKTQAKDRGYIEQTRTTLDIPSLDAEIGRLMAILAGGSQTPIAATPSESSAADAGTG